VSLFRKLLLLFFLLFTSGAESSNENQALTLFRGAPKNLEKGLNQLSFGENYSLSPMPFRLGFEFQEISGLCPWAKKEQEVQKKKIFTIYSREGEIPLWHVEIDDVDIEFVTFPFSPTQKNKLKESVETIKISLKVLQININKKAKISFDEWVQLILSELGTDHFYIKEESIFSNIKDKEIIKPTYQEEINSGEINQLKLFEKEVEWKPVFSPQATIQHPLEDTIQLYFSLLGFNSSYMPLFKTALPLMDHYKNFLSLASLDVVMKFINIYRQKIHGLIFLQAVTLASMTPIIDDKRSPLETDSELLKQTVQSWKETGQVDAKLSLSIMSRRPFSDMYANLKQRGYADYFKKVMGNNIVFMNDVPKYFAKTNYAEQFFSDEGSSLNLWEPLKNIIKQDFLNYKNLEKQIDNENAIKFLLSKGIVSTTMVRNLIDNLKIPLDEERNIHLNKIFENYFWISLKSVEQPLSRLVVDSKAKKLNITLESSSFDALSPPWLLHNDNAMGRYKEVSIDDLKYGEAIVEVRAISSVQPWFLERAGLPKDLTGRFLKYPSEDFAQQALALFEFLENFHSSKNMVEVFFFGLPYAVLLF
jgi:hypothetical protein